MYRRVVVSVPWQKASRALSGCKVCVHVTILLTLVNQGTSHLPPHSIPLNSPAIFALPGMSCPGCPMGAVRQAAMRADLDRVVLAARRLPSLKRLTVKRHSWTLQVGV